MEDSILKSIKGMLGILPDDDAFDDELVAHINAAIAELTQIAVGPEEGYFIEDASNTWSEFTTNASVKSLAKQFIHCAVRLIFDPPSNSFTVDAMSKAKEEAYWRLYIMVNKE